MDRRDFLKEAILLVGGTAAMTTLPGCRWQDAPQVVDIEIRHRLVRISDLMLPRTTTIGAIDVDAAGFVEKLIANWASGKTRQKLLALLGSSELAALETLPDGEAAEALTTYDAAAFGANNKDWKLLKKLIMLGYFGSKQYQLEIAKFELVPGRYDPCAKLEVTVA